MKKNKYRISIVACLFCVVPTNAQQIVLDHDWYLSGEKMTIAVDVAESERTSKVAYVELCDVKGLQTDAVISLTNGRGQGCVFLPSALHSGYYYLSMYTRMGKLAYHKVVPIINTLQKSVYDDIVWQETSSESYASTTDNEDIIMNGVMTNIPMEYLRTYGQRAENEGHCIYARIHRPKDIGCDGTLQVDAMLSVRGKEVHFFNGKMLDDSTVVFNSYNVNGRHTIVLTARTYAGQTLPIDVLPPFATLLPKTLPHLVFNYNRSEIEKRSVQMQMAIGDTMTVDSTMFVDEIFSTKPIASYNLDEYRQFHTVREVLLEYVSFVHRSESYGHNQLYVYNENEDCPALVLIDGIPVHDIDRLLKYDARRVLHISIYDDHYTFGNIVYKGIINIVTRTGKLTNFPLEENSAYLIYDFPQTKKTTNQ